MKEKAWVKIPDVLFYQEGPGVRNAQYTNDGVKLLNVANLVDGKIDLETSDRYISCDEANGKYKHFLCDEGDLIVASSGIKVDYVDKKMGFVTKEMLPLCMNTSTIRFKALDNGQLNIRYFMYYLKSQDYKKQLSKLITGSAQLNYGPSHLEKIAFPICKLENQEEIVLKLDLVSQIMKDYKIQISKYDDLIKARFIELFGDPQCNPHGYKHTKLSDIATYYNGLTYKPENVAEEGTIVLRSSNIQNSQLDFVDTVRVDCAIKELLMVQKNDILMCSRNGSAKLVGKVALIKNIQEPMSFGAFMMIIRSNYFGYLMTYFQMDAFRQQIKTGATTTINQITGRMLDDVTIPLPPMVLVDQFVAFVEQVDKSKLAVQQSLEKTQQLFDSLMQEYFG